MFRLQRHGALAQRCFACFDVQGFIGGAIYTSVLRVYIKFKLFKAVVKVFFPGFVGSMIVFRNYTRFS